MCQSALTLNPTKQETPRQKRRKLASERNWKSAITTAFLCSKRQRSERRDHLVSYLSFRVCLKNTWHDLKVSVILRFRQDLDKVEFSHKTENIVSKVSLLFEKSWNVEIWWNRWNLVNLLKIDEIVKIWWTRWNLMELMKLLKFGELVELVKNQENIEIWWNWENIEIWWNCWKRSKCWKKVKFLKSYKRWSWGIM